jgi:hypothetical protein
MPDLSHLWGSDLAWSPTGDIATADIPTITQQRVLRRLLTAPGDDIWSLDYGAGLASFVGRPGAASAIRAAIRGQIFKESAVAQTPAPVIDLTPDPSGNLYVHIRYADALTGTTQTIAFTT